MLQFKSKHFLTGEELSSEELLELLDGAESLRQNRGEESQVLRGKTVALIFEKPSLRTRVSFSVGIQELGGHVLELLGSQRKSEEPEDEIRVLQGMVHGVMVRTFAHENLDRMATKATIPIINGLSDSHHPCQALADMLTMYQSFGRVSGLRLAYIGDGNNVLNSLLLLAPAVGMEVHYACPNGYQPNAKILARAQKRALRGGGKIRSFSDPFEAVAGADSVYTDVWTSMGFEQENAERIRACQDFQLNMKLFSTAKPTAIAMHCLPMVRGQEITSDVVEHKRSAVFRQAENRLHAQKALLTGLFAAQQAVQPAGLEYSHVI